MAGGGAGQVCKPMGDTPGEGVGSAVPPHGGSGRIPDAYQRNRYYEAGELIAPMPRCGGAVLCTQGLTALLDEGEAWLAIGWST
jgi:hypothetical protein